MARIKYTYQDVKKIVEDAGYSLLSKEEDIINNKGFVLTSTKILVKCPNPNHKSYEAEFNKFKGYGKQHPTRCKKCLADELRISYEDVKKYFEEEGYVLLSLIYVNSKEPLEVICPRGHFTNTLSFSNFKTGNRCKKCAIIDTHNEQRHSYDYVKEYIESFGYTLLSTEYESAKKLLLVQCDKKHKPYDVSFDNFKTGYRCPKCGIVSSSEKNKHSYEYVKNYLDNDGYKLLSETYEGSREKIKILCPNNHEWDVTFDNFQQGNRCPYCNESKGERKIMNWLNKNDVKYIFNQGIFKDLLTKNNKPLRPDFILPDYKIWIEYDGEQHYHLGCFSNTLLDLMNLKYRDDLKDKYAKRNGWKLIRIPYWDFDNIEEILELNLK